MAETPKITLTIVSQDKTLVEAQVDLVTLPTAEGEITVLPGHIPLFTLLQTGELIYKTGTEEATVIIAKGFADVAPNNTLTVMVDTGVHARDLSVQKAEEAVDQAQQTLSEMSQTPRDIRELQMAEASLRLALLQLKVAQRTKKTTL